MQPIGCAVNLDRLVRSCGALGPAVALIPRGVDSAGEVGEDVVEIFQRVPEMMLWFCAW